MRPFATCYLHWALVKRRESGWKAARTSAFKVVIPILAVPISTSAPLVPLSRYDLAKALVIFQGSATSLLFSGLPFSGLVKSF